MLHSTQTGNFSVSQHINVFRHLIASNQDGNLSHLITEILPSRDTHTHTHTNSNCQGQAMLQMT